MSGTRERRDADRHPMTVFLYFNRLEEGPHSELEPLLRRAAEAALRSGGARDGEVSVTFVTPEQMRALNRRYLSREGSTDVIAFDLSDGESLLGDVYICPQVASTNAADRGEDERRELLRLVIHGTLHVLGHDHPEDAARESSHMFALQEELLRGLTGD